MSTGSAEESASLEALSALADGELDDTGAARACARWRSDHAARSSWHAYQLIGDVLRSEDLASHAARDAAFLERLRARLSAEPIRLNPEPVAEPIVYGPREDASVLPRPSARLAGRMPVGVLQSRRRSWMTSTAAAASFVIVAGGVVWMRSPPPALTQPDTALAEAAPAPAAAEKVLVAQQQTLPPAAAEPSYQMVADNKLIRDARLDRYLAAHKQFAGSSALGLPSAFLRSATADGAGR